MDGRYLKLESIRQGGFANVYRAWDFQSKKTVAVKVLREQTVDSVKRFSREERILRENIGNRHVVQILDSNLLARPPYIVLEYSAQGSIEKYKAKLDWQRAARWLSQVSYGLGHIHRQGGFHRDIKPLNILLFTDQGHEVVKLTDYGLARRPSSLSETMTCSVFGTRGYIDPVTVNGDFDWRSDIYSLGVAFKELLTGSRNGYLNPARVPWAIIKLLDSMTDLDLGKRPNTGYICQQLERLLSPQPIPTLSKPGLGRALFGIGAFVAGVAGVLASTNRWDSNAQRYRDSHGRFASGWFRIVG